MGRVAANSDPFAAREASQQGQRLAWLGLLCLHASCPPRMAVAAEWQYSGARCLAMHVAWVEAGCCMEGSLLWQQGIMTDLSPASAAPPAVCCCPGPCPCPCPCRMASQPMASRAGGATVRPGEGRSVAPNKSSCC